MHSIRLRLKAMDSRYFSRHMIVEIGLFLLKLFAITFYYMMVVWLPLTLRTFSIYQQCQKMGRSITVLRRIESRKYHEYWIGVHTTSWLLTADSQKLSFSTLIKVSYLVFWSDKPPQCASSTQLACPTKLSRQARQSLHFKEQDPFLRNFYIFEILVKSCLKYVSASSIWWTFLLAVTPTIE